MDRARRARWAGGAALAAVLVAIAIMGLPRVLRRDAATGAEGRVMPVSVVTVEPATGFSVTQEYTGRIEAPRTSNLGFERGGRLVEIAVAEGAAVTRGQALAHLATELPEAERREMAANLSSAEAVLAELRAGARTETLDAARAQVRELEEQAALAETRKRRLAQLLAERAVSQDAADEATTQAQALAARLAAARAQRDELEAGARTEQLAAQEGQVERLRAGLEAIDAVLEQSRLLAPFDGVVTGRFADEGEVLGPGIPVLRVVEAGPREARIAVPVSLADSLAPGSPQAVLVGDAAHEAVVVAVLPEVDPATRSVPVVLRLANANAPSVTAPVPGQPARIRITVAREDSAHGFWLPKTALAAAPRGLWTCLAVDPDEADGYRVSRRALEIVHVESDRVLVRGLLEAGDRVINDGVHRVVPGQRVAPSPTP